MTNKNTLYVQKGAIIDAPVEEVWDVLVNTNHIQEWDMLPNGFIEDSLELGTEILWPGDYKLTVTGFKPFSMLELNLFDFSWHETPENYNISYAYSLEQQGEKTTLYLEIGDFASIPDGEHYFHRALQFAESALGKIQDLAEAHVMESG